MTYREHRLSDLVAGAGVLMVIAAALAWAAANCSWWQHSFCNDTAMKGLIGTVIFAVFILAIVMFFAGGIAREINMEARAPPPEVDNEIRREYERQSITRKPLLPNLMIVAGMILAIGVSTVILRAIDNAQHDNYFYQAPNWSFLAAGIMIGLAGYYLKRKRAHPAKTNPM